MDTYLSAQERRASWWSAYVAGLSTGFLAGSMACWWWLTSRTPVQQMPPPIPLVVPADPVAQEVVTRENFERIQIGMTFADVDQILGADYRKRLPEQPENMANYLYLHWRTKDGKKAIGLVFEGGKVTKKYGDGL